MRRCVCQSIWERREPKWGGNECGLEKGTWGLCVLKKNCGDMKPTESFVGLAHENAMRGEARLFVLHNLNEWLIEAWSGSATSCYICHFFFWIWRNVIFLLFNFLIRHAQKATNVEGNILCCHANHNIYRNLPFIYVASLHFSPTLFFFNLHIHPSNLKSVLHKN